MTTKLQPWLATSVAVHAGAFALAATLPAAWPWAAGAVIANHALITGAGLWPRSSWLGSNWRTLPEPAALRHEIAITIDDGPDPEVTPRLLDVPMRPPPRPRSSASPRKRHGTRACAARSCAAVTACRTTAIATPCRSRSAARPP